MIKYILIFLLLFTTFAYGYTEEQILKARDLIDAYRVKHSTDEKFNEAVDFSKLIEDLRKLGFNGEIYWDVLEEMFTASADLNAKDLGFKDKEDYLKNAKEADYNKFIDSWR